MRQNQIDPYLKLDICCPFFSFSFDNYTTLLSSFDFFEDQQKKIEKFFERNLNDPNDFKNFINEFSFKYIEQSSFIDETNSRAYLNQFILKKIIINNKNVDLQRISIAHYGWLVGYVVYFYDKIFTFRRKQTIKGSLWIVSLMYFEFFELF